MFTVSPPPPPPASQGLESVPQQEWLGIGCGKDFPEAGVLVAAEKRS